MDDRKILITYLAPKEKIDIAYIDGSKMEGLQPPERIKKILNFLKDPKLPIIHFHDFSLLIVSEEQYNKIVNEKGLAGICINWGSFPARLYGAPFDPPR